MREIPHTRGRGGRPIKPGVEGSAFVRGHEAAFQSLKNTESGMLASPGGGPRRPRAVQQHAHLQRQAGRECEATDVSCCGLIKALATDRKCDGDEHRAEGA
jgi:hypothetical protein